LVRGAAAPAPVGSGATTGDTSTGGYAWG
jgi:hypothetical protein